MPTGNAMDRTQRSAALVAALALSGLAGCTGDGDAGHGAAGPERGYATGRAVDSRGEPIAGAKILLDHAVFYASYIRGTTREDGSYRIRVQPGAWRTHASFEKTYNGRTYTLELHPDSIDSFDEEGVVRNFAWKLEGRRPENDYGYYGGFIQLSTDHDFYEDLENVELTLTPSGPLIDGSEGKVLELRLQDHYWVQYYQIEDIPIGRYLVRATLKSDGESRPLRIQDWHARGDFEQEFQLDFLPETGSGTNNSASIVIGH